MSLLLDTHIFVWLLLDPDRLGHTLSERIADPETRVLLSVVSLWEIGIKHALGKLTLPEDPKDPERWIPEYLRESQIDVLAMSVQHALRVATLPLHHRDPFDRLLIAQAQIEKIPIVTADRSFGAYDIEVIAPMG